MIIKKIALVFASLLAMHEAYSLTDDYSLRTNNKANFSFDITTPSGYEHFYSILMVTKGPSGYGNTINFSNLYLTLKKANNEDQLTKEGNELFQIVSKLNSNISKFPSIKLTTFGENLVGNLGSSFSKSRIKSLITKQDYDKCINIRFVYNGDEVSLQTGEKFVLGMTRNLPVESNIVYEQEINENLLSFYDTNDYKRYLTSYPDLEKVVGTLQYSTQYSSYVDNVVQRIFKKKFVNELTHIGIITDRQTLAKVEGKSFVEDLFEFYKFIPSIDPNLAESYTSLIDSIVRPDERKYFSSVENAKLFYRYGPGLKNFEISKIYASKILEDYLFVAQNEKEEAVDTSLKLLFVDAKASLSFVSYLVGDKVGKSLLSSEVYDLFKDKFKTSKIAPQASVLTCDIFKNKEGKFLYKFSLNGENIKLKSSCDQFLEFNNYYSADNLGVCLNN